MTNVYLLARYLLILLLIVSAGIANSGCFKSAASLRPGNKVDDLKTTSDNETPGFAQSILCDPILYDVSEPSQERKNYRECRALQKALNQAAWDGDVDSMKMALKKGANVNGGYYQEGTALKMATTKGHRSVSEVLLENGADVNEEYEFGMTPLKKAVVNGSLDLVAFLIEKGADVCSNKPDDMNERKRALDIALEKNRKEIAELLKSSGSLDCTD